MLDKIRSMNPELTKQELQDKLGLEFARYKDRWDKLSRSIETVNKDIQNVSVTTDKITKKFETINKVDVNKLLEKKK